MKVRSDDGTHGTRADSREGVSSDVTPDDVPSVWSTDLTHPSHTPRSSFDRGSVSITAEPRPDCASFQPADLSHSSPQQDTPSHDMAGLPLFGHTFRSWMGGTTVSSPKQSNVDSQGHVYLSNRRSVEALRDVGSGTASQRSVRRQRGIREDTDESSDLPRSNDIMQHIAESCHGRHEQSIGTDHRRLGSNTNSFSDMTAPQDSYELLEAEIDQLKEDIMNLKQEANQARTEPKTEQEIANDVFLSTRSRSKPASLDSRSDNSAAARLQRLHAARERLETGPSSGVVQLQPAPSPLDFPVLSSSSSLSSPAQMDDATRKLSYADAATSGMMGAMNHAFSGLENHRADSKMLESVSHGDLSTGGKTTSTASQVQDPSTEATAESDDARDDAYSVIISKQGLSATSRKTNPRIFTEKPSQETKSPVRHSPHFAQPTKSFARRAGETLRKESASVSPKSPSDTTPTKTIKSKEPNLATAKPASQQQQKRKSLPGDWMNSSSQLRESVVEETIANAVSTTGTLSLSALSATSTPTESKKTSSTKEKANGIKSKTKDVQPPSPMRKKTSSYMAPTNATTQRMLATLSEYKLKDEHANMKDAEAQTDAPLAIRTPAPSPRPSTIPSDTSSVQFILETQPAQSHQVLEKQSLAEQKVLMNQEPQNITSRNVNSSSFSNPQVHAQRSPTRGPKPRSLVETQTKQQDRPSSRLAVLSGGLPDIANTTTMRRTSNSDVLAPIISRLESKGLLNRPGEKHESVPTDQAPARKTIPPHLRRQSRETSTTSTSSEVTNQDRLAFGSSPLHIRGHSISSYPAQTALSNSIKVARSGIGDSRVRASTTTPSLRATAKEFTPALPIKEGPLPPPNRRWSLDYIPDEEWLNMSWWEKKKIQEDHIRRQGPQPQSRFLNASRTQREAFNTKHLSSNLAMNSLIVQSGLPCGSMSFVDANGSPNTVQIGPLLKPSLTPRKKTVQWMMQDLDGNETPVKFGRAPAPVALPVLSPSTPTISSASDDTSPLKTPHSLRGWHIGSTNFSPNSYGWTGGDGKEIKFVGYGPHAERDPNSVVNFNFQGRTSSFGAAIPNGFIEEKENFTPDLVAPRSQRQWAEKLGYHKVPCGDVEVTHAVEQLPFGSQLANYCHDCAAR